MESPLNRNRARKRALVEKDLEEIHHNLMVVYGWIPLSEFKQIPLPTLFNLHNKVLLELEKREFLRLASLKFYGVKNPK